MDSGIAIHHFPGGNRTHLDKRMSPGHQHRTHGRTCNGDLDTFTRLVL